MRYEVRGTLNGVPAFSVYKTLPHAKRAADDLKDSEVYDRETKSCVYGTSTYAQMFMKMQKELEDVQNRGV